VSQHWVGGFAAAQPGPVAFLQLLFWAMAFYFARAQRRVILLRWVKPPGMNPPGTR